MTLTIHDAKIIIEGNIKSIDDFQHIKSALDASTVTYDKIVIDIKDSFSMTSSVIGYINKMIQKDHIDVSMNVTDIRLYNTLKELGLISLFKVKMLCNAIDLSA